MTALWIIIIAFIIILVVLGSGNKKVISTLNKYPLLKRVSIPFCICGIVIAYILKWVSILSSICGIIVAYILGTPLFMIFGISYGVAWLLTKTYGLGVILIFAFYLWGCWGACGDHLGDIFAALIGTAGLTLISMTTFSADID